MNLYLKCKCGKALKIPQTVAGKRVNCPQCKHAFVVPAEKFVQQSTRAIAPKPVSASAPAVLASAPASAVSFPTPSELDLFPVSLAAGENGRLAPADSLGDDVFSLLKDDARLAESSAAKPAATNGSEAPILLPYAQDRKAQKREARNVAGDSIMDPQRQFWADAMTTPLYPFKSANNIIIFCMMCGTAIVGIFLNYAGIFGPIGSFIIFGWMAAIYLSIIQDTAAGSEDLPGFKMEDGFIDDIIKPALKYVGAFACAMFPTILLAFLTGFGVIPSSLQSMWSIFAMMVIGIFLWPMIMMLFAFNVMGMVVRIDLMFTTISRTVGPYLALWGMLLCVGFVSLITRSPEVLQLMGINPKSVQFGGGLTMMIVEKVLDVYFTVVSMRLIGLYYLHFKRRFAFTFE